MPQLSSSTEFTLSFHERTSEQIAITASFLSHNFVGIRRLYIYSFDFCFWHITCGSDDPLFVLLECYFSGHVIADPLSIAFTKVTSR